MKRRALLATLGACLLAGCGWQGTDDGSDNSNGDESSIAASDGGDNSSEQDENGGGSESSEQGNNGGDPLYDDPEELLLPDGAFASDDWERQDVQQTGTCRVYEQPFERYALLVESCAAVFDDEETAVQEYEDAVDRARNIVGESIPSEQLDGEIDVGDEAVALGRVPDRTRVVFREANAYGTLDYESEGLLNTENLPEDSEILALARAMYEEWQA